MENEEISSTAPAPQTDGGAVVQSEPTASTPAVEPGVDPSPSVAPNTESAPEGVEGSQEPAKEPTLLGGEAEKPAEPEAPPKEGAEAEQTPEPEKPAEGEKEPESLSEEPAPLPTYEPFTFPDEMKADEARVQEYTGLLGEFERTTKADHAEVQKFGQRLVDYHIAEVKRTVEDMQKAQWAAWEKMKGDWRKDFDADPEIGGNRRETTVKAANEVISIHGGTPEQQAEFRKLMDESGIGNHRVMIRFLSNLSKTMSEGKMVPAGTPAPQKQSKVQAMYGGNR